MIRALSGVASRRASSAAFVVGVALSVLAATERPVAAARFVQTLIRPTTTSTPTTCPSNPYPCANGDTFSYSVKGTETISTPTSSPSIIPYSDTSTSIFSCPVTFQGIPNLCEWQSTLASQPGTVSSTYAGYVPKGPGYDLDWFGQTSASYGGGYTSSLLLTYAPPLVYDKVPIKKGEHFNWDAVTTHETSRTYGPSNYRATTRSLEHPNGTYASTYFSSDPKQHTKLTETRQLSANGSGAFTYALSGPSSSSYSISYGAPTMVGSQWVIPVTTTTGSGSSTVNVPDWFPGGGPAPAKFGYYIWRHAGLATIPSQCGTFAGQQAEGEPYTTFYLDPVRGYVTTGSGEAYTIDGSGVVCENDNVTEQFYDNQKTGALIETVSFTSYTVLTSETLQSLRERHACTHKVGLPPAFAIAPGSRHDGRPMHDAPSQR
ncbi:MAG: hypothetical protein JO043_12900 [Candidatus Eremiobacteraeota bacterium]|nr:hypothetical protein [Candidatus Eremiobacteraeota bacterium]